MKALIVDDSRTIRTILGRELHGLGFEITEAGNGLEALACLRTGYRPDLALVDWNMPEMNGIDFVRQVRADSAYASMRIVMVTSENDLSRVATAIEAGANEYLMKPFNTEALVEKIALLA